MVFTMAGTKPAYTYTVTGAKAKVFDTSRHNHGLGALEPIDFVKAKAAGYVAWAGRASVGDYYIDPWFHRDYDAALAAGLICLAYHVTVPTINAGVQIANFKNALAGRKPRGVVIDMEWNNVVSTPERVTECNQAHADAFWALEWMPAVIAYTNQNYGNTYLLHNLNLPLWVASPGAGGVMNPAAEPSMPKWWPDYLMWQRSWTEAIPGVPDMTTDHSEWNGYGTIEEYFDVQPGDDMGADVIARLDRIDAKLATMDAKLDLLLNGGGVGGDVPPPAGPVVIITAEPRANARYAPTTNANGKPIMQIYPKDTAPTSDRIQFASGALLKVQPGLVVADGGAKYYQLTDQRGRNGEILYVREIEADLV